MNFSTFTPSVLYKNSSTESEKEQSQRRENLATEQFGYDHPSTIWYLNFRPGIEYKTELKPAQEPEDEELKPAQEPKNEELKPAQEPKNEELKNLWEKLEKELNNKPTKKQLKQPTEIYAPLSASNEPSTSESTAPKSPTCCGACIIQ